MRVRVTVGAQTLAVEVVESADGRYRVRIDDQWCDVDARMTASGPYSLLIEGASYLADIAEQGEDLVVQVGGETHKLRIEEPGRRGRGGQGRGRAAAGQRLVAPMPGKVVAVPVKPGDPVEPGAALVVLEAMKMENEFRATGSGAVTEVHVSPGQAVNAGDLLVVIA